MARKDLDTLLRLLGQPGRYQVMVFFLLMSSYFPLAFDNLAMIFIGGKPAKVFCSNESLSKELNCSREIIFRTYGDLATCSKHGKPQNVSRNHSATTLCEDCARNYRHDGAAETTIISEFDLICEDFWLSSWSNTLYFVGMMIGGVVFGILSDKYGRKNSILAASGLAFIGGLGAAFTPNFAGFAVSRTLVGFAIQGVTMNAFTLMMESLSEEYRVTAGAAAQALFSVGVMLLAMFAYVIQNWRYLQLFMTLLVLVTVSYVFFVHESIRWLFLNYRFEEAAAVIKSILRSNSIQNTKKINDCVDYLRMWHQREEDLEDESVYSVWNFFTSAELRRRILGMSFIWFTTGLSYYVIAFSTGDFFGSKYWNLAAAGFVDIPASFLAVFIVSRYGSRLPLAITATIAAILCTIAGCIPGDPPGAQLARTILFQSARGMTQAMFTFMMPYASELFPTVVRSNGLGICSVGLRLGGVLSPQALLLGSYTSKEVPFVICGVMGLVTAGVTYTLPETKGIPLPETVDDLSLLRLSRGSRESTIGDYDTRPL